MQRTFEMMREITISTDMEIVNYNYARVVFTSEEIEKYKDMNHDVVEEFSEMLNESVKDLKENLSVNLKVLVTGNDKNVVLIEGVGLLYENSPDEFLALSGLKGDIINHITSSNARPVLASASAIGGSAPEPVKREVKAVPVKAVKPVKIKKEPEKTTTSSSTDDKYYDVIDEYLDENGLVPLSEAINKLVDSFSINDDEAREIVKTFINKREKVLLEDDFLFKQD